MDAISKFTNPRIGFLLTLAFGFWLARLGKPYNGVLFNIHKLIALAVVIIATVQIYSLLEGSQMKGMMIVSVMVAVAGVVALFASGAFMSIGKMNYQTMKIIHFIGPVLLVVGLGFTIYYVFGRF